MKEQSWVAENCCNSTWRERDEDKEFLHCDREGMNGVTADFLGPKKKAQKEEEENKTMGFHISLTPFLAVESPRAATMAKYWMTRFVLTVLPAPDSPL